MEWQKERSDAIKKYFRAQGIAQTDIAIALNVSKQYVNDVLNGRATIGKVLPLASLKPTAYPQHGY